MSSPQPPVPTGRRRRVAGRAFGAVLLPLACTAALTLGAGLPAASAAAAAPAPDRNHGPADPSWPPTPAKAGGGGTSATVAAAKATAKSTGRPVQIDALTTPTGTTTANPDGTLSTTSAPVVEHVKNADGTWRAVDATLRANPDGTVTPVAVPSALAFSGGGKGPMATMTTADGKKLALKAPFDLPKPELDGAGALYRSVLPDVDLRLSATTAGGWRQVLIVRTVTAAANPEVRKLRLDVLGDGLTVKADAHGNLTAEDAAGTPRFTAPVPAMWDSTPAPPTPRRRRRPGPAGSPPRLRHRTARRPRCRPAPRDRATTPGGRRSPPS